MTETNTVETDPLPEVCPKCGAETIFGYGLCGGGMGPYVVCSADGCDYFSKKREKPEDE